MTSRYHLREQVGPAVKPRVKCLDPPTDVGGTDFISRPPLNRLSHKKAQISKKLVVFEVF